MLNRLQREYYDILVAGGHILGGKAKCNLRNRIEKMSDEQIGEEAKRLAAGIRAARDEYAKEHPADYSSVEF